MESSKRRTNGVALYEFNMRIHDEISDAESDILGTEHVAVIVADHETHRVRCLIFCAFDVKRENYLAALRYVIPDAEAVSYHIVGADINE